MQAGARGISARGGWRAAGICMACGKSASAGAAALSQLDAGCVINEAKS